VVFGWVKDWETKRENEIEQWSGISFLLTIGPLSQHMMKRQCLALFPRLNLRTSVHFGQWTPRRLAVVSGVFSLQRQVAGYFFDGHAMAVACYSVSGSRSKYRSPIRVRRPAGCPILPAHRSTLLLI